MFNFGFGGGPGPRRPQPEVDSTKYYELLGVSKEASQDEIKKSFRKMAVTHHPDKGGDPEQFKAIQKAYETLSDPEKRELYDNYGEEGVENGGPQSGPSDLFDILSGNAGRGRQQSKRRGDDVVFPMKVTLEDLYNGMTKKLRLTKSVICDGCNGKGGLSDSVKPCVGCKGRGVKVIIRQLGPGMIQQMQTFCNECNGEGNVISDKDKCKKCKGAKTVKEKKTLEVFISRGMAHGDKIPFRGESDEAPDTITGDVIVLLQQKEHDVFKRDGSNLIIEKKITLMEALCGFRFKVRHLDGRKLVIRSDSGVVYKPGDVKAVLNEGMPTRQSQFQRGNLYIKFNVVFPPSHSLNDNHKKLLSTILPQPDAEPELIASASAASSSSSKKGLDDVDEDVDMESAHAPPMDTEAVEEEVHLVDVDIEAEARRQQEEAAAFGHGKSDDDDDAHHPRAGCRAQ